MAQACRLQFKSSSLGFVERLHPADYPELFASQYRANLQHLQLKGLRPSHRAILPALSTDLGFGTANH
jgi:hypothetical protein